MRDLDGLGRAFDRNQDLIRALGMTLPENEGLVAVVKAAGALGAKLSGSAGDAVLALAPEPNRVIGALRARGIATLVVQTLARAFVDLGYSTWRPNFRC